MTSRIAHALTSPTGRARIVPLVVAGPMFLQNLDTSVMGTALPAIAVSLNADVLHLNLAITSYLVSLVLFLPASAWLAERYGPRRVFCTAVFLFSVASALCGAATTLGQLIAFRLLQGVGGAMMVPVGRLILLRTIPVQFMVMAMVWFTVPGGIGRLMGPLVGGAIVTVTSWRWIFLVNIPFGLAAVALALYFIDKDIPPTEKHVTPFDVPGLLLMAAALGGMLGALEIAGKEILPWQAIVAMACAGAVALWVYLRRSKAQTDPLIDFKIFRFPIYRAAVVRGIPLRIALGATPFVLPLLFQVGFGMTALQAGLVMMASSVGSLGVRGTVPWAVRQFGHRKLLIMTGATTSFFYCVYTLFTPETPQALIFGVLFLAGMSNAMTMVCLATIGFVDVPRSRMAHATALQTMAQQLCMALGVTLVALLIELTHLLRGGLAGQLVAGDFRPAMIVVAMLPLISAMAFALLPRKVLLAEDEA